MRTGVRRALGLVAIYAIALHTILWGFSPPAGASAIDPFTVICHSINVDALPDQQDQPAHMVPGSACDHCALCSTLAPSPPDSAVYLHFLPARLIDRLGLETAAPLDGARPSPKLARGPPQTT